MANQTTALGALGLTTANVAEIKEVEVKEVIQYTPAGVYYGKIKEFGTYTSASGASMAFAELEVTVGDDTRTMKDYIFIPKDQTEADVKKDRKKASQMSRMREGSIAKINGYINAVGLNIADVEVSTIENDVSKAFNKFDGVAGDKTVAIFIQVEHTAGAQYEWKNIINNVFAEDCTNSKGDDQKEQFLANIAKKPIIEKKAKGGTAATGTGGTVAAPSTTVEL